ncbi:ABC transporter ATP-binding protein [Variovorax saccharolyticus]|uniref:ABC transporter ATP-binding protein n=1 Tax=Variovorax saccharolyticus TaxID=3053516 RepID=UPI00257503C6|nr:ABC transporter ATP-binding protein [Variovorax sp. J31P216]MDM0030089.1 ABC transporter ATP-binding protein [Variovorax sp. J31P216]
MLEIQQLGMSFGGVHALSGVSLAINSGRIYGLIGPNGAGKSTAINAITGTIVPTSGRILWHGKDVARWPQHRRARSGLARTFQNLALFHKLSVRENVTCGAIHAHDDSSLRGVVDTALDAFGLAQIADEPVNVLSLGTRKRVEMARATVANPKLLLLDEPAAGLTGSEIAEFSHRMREFRDQGGAVLLVEHDMSLVMTLCEHLFVLDFGKLIAAGTPDEVRANPAVQAAYFGAGDEQQH